MTIKNSKYSRNTNLWLIIIFLPLAQLWIYRAHSAPELAEPKTNFVRKEVHSGLLSNNCNMVIEHIRIDDAPVVVAKPTTIDKDTPLIIMYHGFGPPASPEELMEAIPPLPGSVTVYPTLPLTKNRMPMGGIDELRRRQSADYIGQLLFPSISEAARELPKIVDALKTQLGLSKDKGVALFGFSAGGAATLLGLIESDVPVRAAVAVNAPLNIRQAVDNWEKLFARKFNWSAPAKEAAQRYDVAAKAETVAQRNPATAILLLQGDKDEYYSPEPVKLAVSKLRQAYHGYENEIQMQILKNTTHHFAADNNPAQNNPAANTDNASMVVLGWFSKHLGISNDAGCANGG
ncbi:alpha/beta hydrolase family protein [Microbulbifer rhizosphaerae]|uniref:Dienelactone hydrolase n=1 Tax=Microbulbifer rhizosphaerae TaxID=1562603 RepID=A0A7W4WEW9_9GAMM|nr:prolyl oligopeptidase family serine peptidase [Microbulbifer rhizosphaerae]MBB3062482.1 dienelactone hydrolase [Microbulbifer rhizosphaerae]